MAIKHTFQSSIEDDSVAQAAGEVLPSHWNAAHTIEDGSVSLAHLAAGVQTSLGKADSAVQPAALNSYQPLASVLTNTTASFTTADETKLDGIATGATANSSDATLLDRTNHTGTQAISTVTGLQTALDAKAATSSLGTAAFQNTGAFATAAQGALADSALQAVPSGIDATKIANGSVSNAEFQYLGGATSAIQTQINAKQAALVSGTNIKTINGNAVLGSGDLTISTGVPDGDKGDIIVSSSGATWTIDSGVITEAKLDSIVSGKIKAALMRAAGVAGGYISGEYYDNANCGTPRINVSIIGATKMHLFPLVVKADVAIDRVGFTVATGVAGATGKVLIYGSDSSGNPDALLWEGASNLDCSTSGTLAVESLSLTLEANKIYWFGVRLSTTVTLRVFSQSNAPNLGISSATSTNYYTGISRTINYANAAPSSFGFTSADRVSGGYPISVLFRAA